MACAMANGICHWLFVNSGDERVLLYQETNRLAMVPDSAPAGSILLRGFSFLLLLDAGRRTNAGRKTKFAPGKSLSNFRTLLRIRILRIQIMSK